MEQKLAVYICTDCDIGKTLDIEKLKNVAANEFKADIVKTSEFLCGQEGAEEIRNDINNEGVNTIVIAACSPRVHTDIFDFDPLQYVTERVNLREQIVWTQTGLAAPAEEETTEAEPAAEAAAPAEAESAEAAAEAPAEGAEAAGETAAEEAAPAGPVVDENTQEMAEDHLRMGIVRAKKSEPPEPFIEDITRSVMVIGGGVTGITSALEAAEAGYQVFIIEKEAELGGWASKMYRILPDKPPFAETKKPDINAKIEAVQNNDRIRVLTGASIESTEGMPGQYKVTVNQNGGSEVLDIGTIVLATGWKPYDATKLGHLGYGKFKNVITNVEMEENASKNDGSVMRPSDGAKAKRVAFLQCAGQRDPEHLPYCSSVCCLASLKQALYVTESDPDASAYIIYKDMRTPGLYEDFYKSAQNNPGVMLTKGEMTSIAEDENGNIVMEIDNTILGEKVIVEADMLVLATGMVTTALPEGVEDITDLTPEYVGTWKETTTQDGVIKEVIADPVVLNLKYRQGPEMPYLKWGFPDSHFVCFPYETRRTGIYAAGAVRHPMSAMQSATDGVGAALKAIQCLELSALGKSVHPRSGDTSFPEINYTNCTQCRRCTVECPFGVLDEDEKGTPKTNTYRCRRCGTCMGACPQRIISFKNYSVDMIASMMKAVKVPEEEEKPRIIALVCENDAYPALDIAGLNRSKISPFYRIIPMRCLGGTNLVWIADALSAGIEGFLLIGCRFDDDYQCHFIKGSKAANERLGKVQETLGRLMLEAERVTQVELAINEWDRLPEIMDDFAEQLKGFGPNPFKGF
jgi:quinone-modifying oxidoreductase subunit QmoB